MLNNILAKSPERGGDTLVQHTNDIVKQWERLKQKYSPHLDVDDFFWNYSFLSVLFHDTGKIALNFQDKLCGRVKNYDNYIRHEFLSGTLLLNCSTKEFMKNPLPLLAIFSHHKPLIETKLFEKDEHKVLRANEADFLELRDYLLEKIQDNKAGFDIPEKLILALSKENKLTFHYTRFRNFLSEVCLNFNQESRKQYVFYKAILNTADWCASGHKQIDTEFEISRNSIEKKLKSKIKNDKIEWREFQLDCEKQASHTLAIAPTGSGKTEAALLWASKKQAHEKVIYLLPTRVTSNAIFERLKEYFHRDNTSVVHSSAFFYQKDLDDNFNKGKYLVDKTFFKNVNICTIDQVLTQGFNLGYWEIKTFNMLNGWVVIDEIHLYAPYTLGLIISTIKYLKKEFGVRFFIMTATMPRKLQTLLKDTLEISEKNVVRDTELLLKERNTFEVRDTPVDDILQEIITEIKLQKKVLVVVNTVDEAIRLYQKLNGIAEHTICYHSRFIQKDRLKKEKEILDKEEKVQSLLLVATQVVEVSLDIDFDIIFSENAPIDAIVQRAGRVNRKRYKNPDATKVIVFKEQDVTREVIYTKVDSILENTFDELKKRNGQKLNEEDLLNLVDTIYKDYNVEEEESYKLGLNAYKEVQKKLAYIKDNDEIGEVYTREGIDSVNVIPYDFYEKLVGADASEKAKHELSIRLKKLRAIIYKGDFNYCKEEHYHYLGCKYTEEVGFELGKPSEQKSIY